MNYGAHYLRLVERAQLRGKLDGYSERHHVVPRCLGGSDDPVNLVFLTAEEHYVAHQLLVKMNPGHYGLAYAAMLMTRKGRGFERVTNKHYSWLKIRFSKLKSSLTSEQMKGNSNLKGKTHSGETKAKISEKSKAMWLNEEIRLKHVERVKKMWEDPERRKRMTGNAVGKRVKPK